MKVLILFISLQFMLNNVVAQQMYPSGSAKRVLFDIRSTKTGPYVGIQRGKYTVLEMGGVRQWKQIRIIKPVVQAAHLGLNYNFKYNVLGADVGYWIRPHRLGFTYGGTLLYRTDFTYNKLGLAPVIGFKFWLLHLQAGYHFMSRPNDFETNTLFVSLRLGWINDRDIEWKRDKKKIV